MLRRLDAQLGAFSSTIRTGIDALEERTGEVVQAQDAVGGYDYDDNLGPDAPR
jgi:hypothetical protein